MKATKPAPVQTDVARARVILWLETEAPETVAGWIGCVVQSVLNWSKGGKISRLSARAIMAVKARK